jgi:hypothetical protein
LLYYNEYVVAVKKLNNNKTPGSDSLPAEIYKYNGPNVNNRLFELILKIWNQKLFIKIGVMPLFVNCTKIRVRFLTAVLIEASPFYPLPVKS